MPPCPTAPSGDTWAARNQEGVHETARARSRRLRGAARHRHWQGRPGRSAPEGTAEPWCPSGGLGQSLWAPRPAAGLPGPAGPSTASQRRLVLRPPPPSGEGAQETPETARRKPYTECGLGREHPGAIGLVLHAYLSCAFKVSV